MWYKSSEDDSEDTVKKRWFKKSYRLQMSLVDRVLFNKEEVMEVQRTLTPCQLEDISHERASIGLCGHVGCGMAPRPSGGKKWFVDRKSNKVWDQQELDRFCSKECFRSYNKLRTSLQDEPAWNEATQPTIAPIGQARVEVSAEPKHIAKVHFQSCAASSTAPVTSLSLDHLDAVVPESNVSALFPGFKVNATPCRSKTSLRTKYNRRREERIIAKEEEDSSVVSMKEDDEKEDDEEETRIEELKELKESKVDEVETVKECVDVSTLVSGVTKEIEDVEDVSTDGGLDNDYQDDDWGMAAFHDSCFANEDQDPDPDDDVDLSRREDMVSSTSFFVAAWKFLSSVVQDKTHSFLRNETIPSTEVPCERRTLLLERWYPWIHEYQGEASSIAQFVSTFRISTALPGVTADETLLLRFVLLLCIERLSPSDVVEEKLNDIARRRELTELQMSELRGIFK